ncbi:hypothetical protein EMCRGX_G019820 [Ephydatia muelleri]
MGYNELVASLSAGSAAVFNLMVRDSIIIYSHKINAFDEIHLKNQQSLILPSPPGTTPFWTSLKALTAFAQLGDLVAKGNEVNDSDIMVTNELMKPLKRNLCSYAFELGFQGTPNSQHKNAWENSSPYMQGSDLLLKDLFRSFW